MSFLSKKILLIILLEFLTIIQFINSENSVDNDIDCANFDLVGIVPFKEVSAIITNAIRYDHETQNAANFLQSDEFKNLCNHVLSTIQHRPLLEFIGGLGLQFADVMDHLTDSLKTQKDEIFNENHLSDGNYVSEDMKKQIGLGGVVRKLISVLPAEKVKHCFNLKLNAKPAFKHIVEQINAPEFQSAVETVRHNDEYQTLSSQLVERGIEFNTWLNEAIKFFELQQST